MARPEEMDKGFIGSYWGGGTLVHVHSLRAVLARLLRT